MKQTLPDIIRQNEDLRKLLLAQDGGIMKYLAEHLEANGNAELFHAYQDHCVDIFFEKNKWDLGVVWEGENMRRAALGFEHLWREVRYQRTVKNVVGGMSEETIELVSDFTELYLTWAYRQNRQRWFPNGLTAREVYREALGMFSTNGLGYKCMKIVLSEHHAKSEIEKTETDWYKEFQIRQYVDQLTNNNFAQWRQAVAEMLAGKDADQCRQMAIDTMERVRGFSQMIYSESMVRALREINFNSEADQRERDGEWLRDVAQRAVLEEFSDHVKTHSMGYYFAIFVNLLAELGRIWAAQLLVHGIDMKELEEGVACIMNPMTTPRYYVDKYYSDELPDQHLVSDDRRAKELLKRMNGDEQPEGNNDSDETVDEQPEGNNDSDETAESDEQLGTEYYGQDFMIFHENLDVGAIAVAVKTLPRGELTSDRKFFMTVYLAFMTLHWLTNIQHTKFISWMKYHSGIHFKTNNFKNISFDDDMKDLLPQIIEVFSDAVDEGRYDDKKKFYRKNPQGDYLIRINKGYD